MLSNKGDHLWVEEVERLVCRNGFFFSSVAGQVKITEVPVLANVNGCIMMPLII